MNAAVFEDYVKKRVLPFLPGNGVFVVDRAPYHVMLTPESRPITGTRKEVLVKWLVDHGGKDENGVLITEDRVKTEQDLAPCRRKRFGQAALYWTNARLLAIGKEMKPTPVFQLQQWISDFNATNATDIKLLILPVATPRLNPIEYVWSVIKRYVRTRNTRFTMSSVKALTLEAARDSDLMARAWNAGFRHMLSYQKERWELDKAHVTLVDADMENATVDADVDPDEAAELVGDME